MSDSYATRKENPKDYWAYTICSGCYNLCGVKVRVVDGIPVAVEGVPESDMGGQGGMCGKGVATIMDFHDPNRVRYPVKRTNPKKGLHEDPKWERISWEEALDTIAEKLKAAIEKDPRQFVWSFTPGPGTPFKATIYHSGFCISCGSRNQAFGGVGSQCGAAAHHAGALMHAAWDILPDYRYCNFVFRCGGNEGHGGGRMAATSMRQAAAARDRGMRTIVMDPIGFRAAADADEWIPILPATDIAVFLAMANIIVNEIGRFDIEYLRNKTNGVYLVGPDELFVRDQATGKPLVWDEVGKTPKMYDDPTLMHPALEGEFTVNGVKCHPGFALWKERIKPYNPEWASEISTVPADRIRRLAEEFVDAAKIGSTIEIDGKTYPYRPACVVGYKGVQTHQNAFHQYLAMNLLNVLMGNQDVPGGIVGSGTVRSFGHPESGKPKFEPYGGVDGMLTPGIWHTRTPWPPHKVEGPGMVNLLDIMADSSMNPYPYTDDFDEIWDKIGRPYEVEVFGMYGGNVVMNIANSQTAENFLKKIPFMFSVNLTHNETTEGFADIVLPDVHAYESYDVASSVGFFFNYPIGLDKWSFHVRIPVIEKPEGELEDTLDIYFELADRIGIRDKYNQFLDNYFSNKSSTWEQVDVKDTQPTILGPEEKISSAEFTDRVLKFYFGEDKGVEWFKENGYITWEKNSDEAYWRYHVDARIPMYFETVAQNKPKTKEICEEIGIHFNWDYYTPLISYFPSVIYTELPEDSEYDLIGVSYRDVLHTHRFFLENPLVDEMSASNPYTYNVVINADTAKEKGLADGDWIAVKSHWGDKVEGRVKTSQLVHPKVLAVVGLGGWAKGRPIAKDKGVNFNELLRADYKHMCPVVGSFEICSRLKAYKIKGRSEK
ncbi:MAG: molybdopterin-dependent oxidoreductase [Deltaproteobacteria bacterium]|nr:molybdopterin-dependent oxidoreductase [Deltaproteobacteria bacterium]